jgi:hypothetical protein
MMNIYYQNSAGARFTLYGDGLTFIDPMELHTWEWSYTLSNRITGMGGDASDFARYPQTFELELRMRGMNREEFLNQVNTFHNITETDMIAGTPGRLYVDEQYLTCYLATAGEQPRHPRNSNFMTRTVTVLAVEPYWCTPVQITMNPLTDEPSNENGKKYDGRYAYRYGTSLSGMTIINDHYAPAPAIIEFYGPISNPSIIIDGVTYGVDVTLTATDRLVIDQITHKIYTVSETGVKTNRFNARNKYFDIFTPIPVGSHTITYSGDFMVSITMIQQRSELRWTA